MIKFYRLVSVQLFLPLNVSSRKKGYCTNIIVKWSWINCNKLVCYVCLIFCCEKQRHYIVFCFDFFLFSREYEQSIQNSIYNVRQKIKFFSKIFSAKKIKITGKKPRKKWIILCRDDGLSKWLYGEGKAQRKVLILQNQNLLWILSEKLPGANNYKSFSLKNLRYL